MIKIDGTEGGGQMLRSALSLSLITGQPFHMTNIRGKRSKPGLKRQHLSCVLAALKVCDGSADGAEMNSKELLFNLGTLKAGDYHINIGSAGSTSLVAQTLIPALVHLDLPSTLTIEGGTHNPMAPSFHFLEKYYIPSLLEMGYEVDIFLIKSGFVPAGGGQIEIKITPSKERNPLVKQTSEDLTARNAIIYHHQLPQVAEKISKLLKKKDPDIMIQETKCPLAECKGLTLQLENIYGGGAYSITTEMVAEYGLKTQNLIQKILKAHHTRHAVNAPVGNRLADQLMLYIAQIPHSQILTGPMTNHIKTNAEVIKLFLPDSLEIAKGDSGVVMIKAG